MGINYLIVQHPLSYIVRMPSSKENGYLTGTTGITDTNMLLGQCLSVCGGGGEWWFRHNL